MNNLSQIFVHIAMEKSAFMVITSNNLFQVHYLYKVREKGIKVRVYSPCVRKHKKGDNHESNGCPSSRQPCTPDSRVCGLYYIIPWPCLPPFLKFSECNLDNLYQPFNGLSISELIHEVSWLYLVVKKMLKDTRNPEFCKRVILLYIYTRLSYQFYTNLHYVF